MADGTKFELPTEVMKMKKLNRILALLAVTALIGCVENGPKPKQTPHDKSGLQDAISENTSSQGTIDGGGGNMINGRPLEDYIVDVTQLPEYEAFISGLIEKVQEASIYHMGYGYNLSNVLKSAIDLKTWYILPVRLESIDREKLGLPVYSDQYALQTHNEVFIDGPLREEIKDMSALGKILLHELVMSAKLLKFSSERRQCEFYNSSGALCLELDNTDETIQLSEKDYAGVRALTNHLWSIRSIEELDNVKLLEVLSRSIEVPLFSNWDFMYKVATEFNMDFAPEDLLDVIEQQKILGKNEYLVISNGELTDQTCDIAITFTETGDQWQIPTTIEISVSDGETVFGKNAIVLEGMIFTVPNARGEIGMELLSMSFSTHDGVQPQATDTFNVDFLLDERGSQLLALEIRKMVTYKVSEDGTSSTLTQADQHLAENRGIKCVNTDSSPVFIHYITR